MNRLSARQQQIILPVLYTLLLLTLVSVALLSLVPPVSRDALTHHLAIPKLYIRHGGIYEIPGLDFSYYPMNLDLLYMIPLYFGNDIIPKFIHFLFALLTGGLIYSYLANKLGKLYGLLGALFFLSIPIIIKLSITVYVDLGLIFFTTASMLLLFKWIEKKYRYRYLITAGVCCGLAVGTKYNGLISLLLLSSCTPILFLRTTEFDKRTNLIALKHGFFFALSAIAIASPWLVRNAIWTGNPLYPLFDHLFHPTSHAAGSAGIDIFTTRRLLFHESPLQILLLPFRIFFEGQDNNPQYFDGRLNPFLLLLPLCAFMHGYRNKVTGMEEKSMAVFSILFLFFALFQTGMRIRYIAPIIPFLVILSMFGLHNLTTLAAHFVKDKPAITSMVSLLLITLMLGYNGQYLAQQFRHVRPFEYLSGKIDKDTYISRYIMEYPVIVYANHNNEKNGKTLCLYLGNRGYYMDFPHVFDVPTNKNSAFAKLVNEASAPSTLAQTLRNNGYTRILLRNDLTNLWLNNLKKNKNTAALFFQQKTALIYGNNGYSLIDILPE